MNRGLRPENPQRSLTVTTMETPESGGGGIAVTAAEVDRQRLIEDRLRRQAWDAAEVERILRYGAFVGTAIECYPVLERAMERARIAHHGDGAGRPVGA